MSRKLVLTCTKAEKTAIQTVLNSKEFSNSNPSTMSLRKWTEYSISNLINFKLLRDNSRRASITIPIVRDVSVRDESRFGLTSEELCRSVDVDWIDTSLTDELKESLTILSNWDDELLNSGIYISDFSKFVSNVVIGVCIHQLVVSKVITVDFAVNEFEPRAKFKTGVVIEFVIGLLNINERDGLSLQSYVVTLTAIESGKTSNGFSLVSLAYKIIDEAKPKILSEEKKISISEGRIKDLDEAVAAAKSIGRIYSELSTSLSAICSSLRSDKKFAELLVVQNLSKKVGVNILRDGR